MSENNGRGDALQVGKGGGVQLISSGEDVKRAILSAEEREHAQEMWRDVVRMMLRLEKRYGFHFERTN